MELPFLAPWLVDENSINTYTKQNYYLDGKTSDECFGTMLF